MFELEPSRLVLVSVAHSNEQDFYFFLFYFFLIPGKDATASHVYRVTLDSQDPSPLYVQATQATNTVPV